MWLPRCAIFARIPWKPCIYCVARSCGRTGKPKSPDQKALPLTRERRKDYTNKVYVHLIEEERLEYFDSPTERVWSFVYCRRKFSFLFWHIQVYIHLKRRERGAKRYFTKFDLLTDINVSKKFFGERETYDSYTCYYSDSQWRAQAKPS
jgi:hypothetical protein